MSQWVQSKYSKDAKKWEVDDLLSTKGHIHYYAIDGVHVLPKEEYIPCDPPERWETCTRKMIHSVWGETETTRSSFSVIGPHPTPHLQDGYRWNWSEKDPDALVIQRKVTE